MKILELRFKNLNSLYDQWMIDFTDPEYTLNGIFLLTGATGAGKTTILDAICLALYGCTPRLRRITKSSNEIMSRQTGECYAEVMFESQMGRFRCHWEQRRARKQKNGALQEPEHQIADVISGKILETKKSVVLSVVEKKTGMDFDRFTRSILLAQGDFDAFLKASVEKKSTILEQITGTRIYSDISRLTYQRFIVEKERLTQLQASISGVELLEKEQEVQYQQDLKTHQVQASTIQQALNQVKKSIDWLEMIQALKKEVSDLNEQSIQLQKDIDEFQPKRHQLQQAVKANAIEVVYTQWLTIKQQQQEDQTQLSQHETQLPQLINNNKEQAQQLQQAQQALNSQQALFDQTIKLIQQTRLLDQSKLAKEQSLSQLLKKIKNEQLALTRLCDALQLKQNDNQKAQAELTTLTDYLQKNQQDAQLINELASIEKQFNDLSNQKKDILNQQAIIKEKKTTLDQQEQQLANVQKTIDADQSNVKELDTSINTNTDQLNRVLDGRTLREYQTEKDYLFQELTLTKRILDLEEDRARLKKGQACPLCGAKEHPFSTSSLPTLNAVEKKIERLTRVINDIQQQQDNIEKIVQQKKQVEQKIQASQLAYDKKWNQKTIIQTITDNLYNHIKELRNNFSKLKDTLLIQLKPFSIDDINVMQLDIPLQALQNRVNRWQTTEQKHRVIEKNIVVIQAEIQSSLELKKHQENTIDDSENEKSLIEKNLIELNDQRYQLLQNQNPDEKEHTLKADIKQAEFLVEQVSKSHQEDQKKLTQVQAVIDSLAHRIETQKKTIDTCQKAFFEALIKADFVNETQFLSAKLDQTIQENLAQKQQQLDNDKIALESTRNDRIIRLNQEENKKITNKAVAQLQQEYIEKNQCLTEIQEMLSHINNQLSNNELTKKHLQSKQKIIEQQKKECYRWEELKQMIGSSDGKKYRSFAQGLTFELMVAHANKQLEKMTGRYFLFHDHQQSLELNVVDNYHAGEVRSIKNLSGGESFIVSLALALGLAKMSSRTIRVDSLFLDEGFGTLDEESLDVVLDALSSLQKDGKLIGIISHISVLKERIGTQINVMTRSRGKSVLSGFGCQRIKNSI